LFFNALFLTECKQREFSNTNTLIAKTLLIIQNILRKLCTTEDTERQRKY